MFNKKNRIISPFGFLTIKQTGLFIGNKIKLQFYNKFGLQYINMEKIYKIQYKSFTKY